MVIFRSINAERRSENIIVKVVLLLAALVIGGGSLLHAGTVITLTNGSQFDGKLSVGGTTLHTQGEGQSTPTDTDLTDVLECRFSDAPFSLNMFYPGKGTQLPANWVAKDLGSVQFPGSAKVQDGSFTIAGSSTTDKDPKGDHCFYFGVPWTENGQLTARLVSLDPDVPQVWAGLVARDSVDPMAPMALQVVDKQGQNHFRFRHDAGGDGPGPDTPQDLPVWMRLSRSGNTVVASVSTDGNVWNIFTGAVFKPMTNPVLGLTTWSTQGNHAGTAVFDNVSITPLPSTAKILPAGVVLKGGSVLAGHFNHIDFSPAAADNNGEFARDSGNMPISRSAVAAIITLPMERSKLAEVGSTPTVLMRNGDTMDGTVTGFSSDQVAVSSVLLGATNYRLADVRACIVQAVQMKPAPFEVRLRDGSILYANSVTGDADEVVVSDVSGLSIQAKQADVAQIRAGPSVAQDLAQVPYKVTAVDPPPAPTPAGAPASGAAPAPASAVAPAPGAAAAANNVAPAANPAPPAVPPDVQSWLGNDQEQILESGLSTNIEFPMTGKARAFGVQVALASDSPPNATAIIHILADGHEVAKSPPFRSGDVPRFLELSVANAAHISLQAESMFPGTKVLYIDPVALLN